MNTFDSFSLSGANIARYLPVYGNANGIVGAYRKYAEPHKKYESSPLEPGQIPLFLLDGEVSEETLRRAAERLGLTAFVALYRSYDVKLKKRYEEALKRVQKIGYLRKNGEMADWVKEDIHRFKATEDDVVRDALTDLLQPVFDFENARDEYYAAVTGPPIDAATRQEITGDLNEYLFRRSSAMYPLGVESVLTANLKQSAIPKIRYFLEGMEDAPAPAGVRKIGDSGVQTNLFDAACTTIDDSVETLSRLLTDSIENNGAVSLTDIITHCSEIGLYMGNVAYYAIGAACRGLLQESTVFYDGVACWKFAEVRDIGSWIRRAYETYRRHRPSGVRAAALFFDNTPLRQRIGRIFGQEAESRDMRFDTLGMTAVRCSAWIVENLRYPIAFLDETLYELLNERALYGEKLRRYNAYFTEERCEHLRERLPQADALACQAIMAVVGYDPDTTGHVFSDLPKGHYAPVLYSADFYLSEMKSGAMVS